MEREIERDRNKQIWLSTKRLIYQFLFQLEAATAAQRLRGNSFSDGAPRCGGFVPHMGDAILS